MKRPLDALRWHPESTKLIRRQPAGESPFRRQPEKPMKESIMLQPQWVHIGAEPRSEPSPSTVTDDPARSTAGARGGITRFMAVAVGFLLAPLPRRDERGLSQSTENAVLLAGAVIVAGIVIAAVRGYVESHMPQ